MAVTTRVAVCQHRTRALRLGLWTAIIITLPSAALAQRLPLKTYTTTDGLARDHINRIVLDSRGFLWFCTPEGLSRFDGYDFLNYGAAEGLQGSVRDLLETHDGIYWIATASGLYRFDPADVSRPLNPAEGSRGPNFMPFYPGPSKPARSVNVIKEDRSGVIWLGTDQGLYRLDQRSFSPMEIGLPENADDRTVMAILFDRAGSTWIGATSGLYRLGNGSTRRYTATDGLPSNDVRALLEDREGSLWIGTTEGLLRLNPNSNSTQFEIAQTYTTKSGLTHDWVTALLQTTDGRLWIGTNRGLSEFAPSPDGGAFQSYTNGEGLTTDEIQSLAEDSDGELWIGTESGGAMKLARSGFVSYAKIDGLANTRIASIFEDAAGELCVLSSHSGELYIHRFDGKKFFVTKPDLSERVNYSWGWNQLVVQDSTGEWWLPTAQGLYRFPRLESIDQLSRVRPRNIYTTRDGLPGDLLFRLYEDKRGDIWIGSINPKRGALGRWERSTGKFQVYSPAEGVPQFMAPTAFREDRNGKLWIGFYDGTLARYDDGHFTSFDVTDGLPEGIIRDLFLDHTGSLWVATNRGGVVRVDDTSNHPRFASFTTAEGLASNQATCVTEDQQGRMYIGTANGIDRLDQTTGHVKHYTTADGLVNNFVNVAYRDRQGALWFGTLQGLSRLVPDNRADVMPPPLIFINGLRIAGEPYALSHLGQKEINGPELSANQNDLQIDFSSVSVGNAASLRYQYKLEGTDREWSAPTTQRSITYARLSPGTYRFLVRAINIDDVASAQPASVSFKILRPVWQRWWSLSLAALLVVGVAYVIHRYRVNRLLELERVRTRIATDLHDDIGSSLSQIAILSEVVRQNVGQASARVNEPLSRITTSSSELMGTMSDIVWAIDPHKDRLADLTQRMRRFASDVLTARSIDFEFQAPDISRKLSLGADVRRQVFLVFKESINNIVRHSAGAHVDIDFRVERDLLILLIRDDGQGFDPAHESDGHGLVSMHSRAKEMGGTLEVSSRPGEGTSVTLEMPISGRSRLSSNPNGR